MIAIRATDQHTCIAAVMSMAGDLGCSMLRALRETVPLSRTYMRPSVSLGRCRAMAPKPAGMMTSCKKPAFHLIRFNAVKSLILHTDIQRKLLTPALHGKAAGSLAAMRNRPHDADMLLWCRAQGALTSK